MRSVSPHGVACADMATRLRQRHIGYVAALWLTVSQVVTAVPGNKPHPVPVAPLSATSTSGTPAQEGTGDAGIDMILVDINRYAQRYPDAFVDEMARYYAAPRELTDSLLHTQHWAAGDIYYACALARIAGQPCRAVADRWRTDHDQGWKAVALQFGIATDAAGIARLRQGLTGTYQRWSRPLPPLPPS